MEKFQVLRDDARKAIRIADHMLTTTYPLLRDPKLLVSAAKNIYLAVELALSSLLEYERLFKRIPAFQDNFESKYRVYTDKIVRRYNIRPENPKLLLELREIVQAHKNSPVEFSRKEKFVICSPNYDLKTLSEKDLKKYLNEAKVFIEETIKFTRENERIFR